MLGDDDEPQPVGDMAVAEAPKADGLRAWLRSLYISVQSPAGAELVFDLLACSAQVIRIGSFA